MKRFGVISLYIAHTVALQALFTIPAVGAIGSTIKDACLTTWEAYDNSLTTYPITAKAGTSGFGFFVGDIVAQLCMKKPDAKAVQSSSKNQLLDVLSSFDFKRLFFMTAFGVVVHGPFCHYMFQALEQNFPGKQVEVIALKIFIDQGVVAPFFNAFFLSYMGVVNGQGPKAIQETLKKSLGVAVFTSWKVWPAVQIITYNFIPLKFRVLFVNLVQVFYSVFLSSLGNQGKSTATDTTTQSSAVKGK